MRSIKITILSLLAIAAFPWRSSAQTYDSSGNGLLNGTYYVRQVIYVVQESEEPEGTVAEAINTYGNITFDGNGNYTFSGSYLDAASGSITPVALTSSGTYVISASGMGYITAINTQEVYSTDLIIGLVSHGIFIGSTTQNTEGYNDLFIATPVGSPEATNATLNGSYAVAYMDPTFYNADVPGGDAFFTMNANGAGSIGSISVQGYLGDSATVGTEALTGVTYAFTNGAAQLNFGGSTNGSTLIGGTHLLYISPDGNFIFGGSANGFDMFVGVRAATGNPTNYNGLYYQAGLDLYQIAASEGVVLLDSYYGSLDAFTDVTGNNIIGHQNVNSQLEYDGASDYTYYDTYTLNGDGTSSDYDFGQNYWSTADGSIRIGYGVGPYLGINVALQAPAFSGSGVYLNPTGMLNAASSAPFTAHLSPGEFLTLYGTNLAPSAASATTFPLPDTLNGVKVTISGNPAPIDYVSPTQINVVVPYATPSIAQIQVENGSAVSNIVTQFVGYTSAGVFTYEPAGGIGYAAALHAADYSVVTTASPAQIGETVAVYLSGFGAVSGFPVDGGAAPSSPLDTTTNTPYVYIDDSAGNDTEATVTYSGLAPGFAGLYQVNFTVPSGVASGPTSLEIIGPDSDTVESELPVGTQTDATPAARAKSMSKHPMIHRHRLARPATVSANQP